MITCGPGIRTEATVSTRTSVTEIPKRLAIAAQTPAIMRPFLGRASELMPPVCRAAAERSSGLTPVSARYFVAALLSFFTNSVCASSSDRPLVSGTTLNTKTNDRAANSAYMP